MKDVDYRISIHGEFKTFVFALFVHGSKVVISTLHVITCQDLVIIPALSNGVSLNAQAMLLPNTETNGMSSCVVD